MREGGCLGVRNPLGNYTGPHSCVVDETNSWSGICWDGLKKAGDCGGIRKLRSVMQNSCSRVQA